MKEEIQIIERDGKSECAVLPCEEYLKLVEPVDLKTPANSTQPMRRSNTVKKN